VTPYLTWGTTLERRRNSPMRLEFRTDRDVSGSSSHNGTNARSRSHCCRRDWSQPLSHDGERGPQSRPSVSWHDSSAVCRPRRACGIPLDTASIAFPPLTVSLW